MDSLQHIETECEIDLHTYFGYFFLFYCACQVGPKKKHYVFNEHSIQRKETANTEVFQLIALFYTISVVTGVQSMQGEQEFGAIRVKRR